MGRMHAPGKGIARSSLPWRRSVPSWFKLTSIEVEEQIFKLAKKVREACICLCGLLGERGSR